MKRKDIDEKCIYQEKEFSNDIVFARYINYMRKALLNRRLNYLRHKKYLLEKEISMSNEEWKELSNRGNSDHSFFSKRDLKFALNKSLQVLIVDTSSFSLLTENPPSREMFVATHLPKLPLTS